MITTNKIIEKFQQDSQWFQKILIGGLLMFVPIFNFFALGYLYRFAANIHESGRIKLPDWQDWGKLFLGGLIFFGIFFLYSIVPLLAGWAIYLFLSKITMGVLGWFLFLPLSILLVIVPSLTIVGIFAIISGKKGDSLFLKVGTYFKTIYKFWKPLLIANLTFIGLQFVGAPLYGIAFFVGFLFLIPYTLFVLNSENKE